MVSPLDQPESSPRHEAQTITDKPHPEEESERQRLAIEDKRRDETSGQAKGDEEPIQRLDLGEGNVIKLDKLGPMIINSDGTLSRIQNWQELSTIEQERTVRLLVKKRNLVRLRKLDEENKQEVGNNDGEEQLTASQEGQKE